MDDQYLAIAQERAAECNRLEAEVERLKEVVANLTSECHAHAEQHVGDETELAAANAQANQQSMNNSQTVRDIAETEVARKEAGTLRAKARDEAFREAFQQHSSEILKIGNFD